MTSNPMTALEEQLLQALQNPQRFEDLRRLFPEVRKFELNEALTKLTADGLIMKNKKNRYASAAHYGCRIGKYLATERDFAFVAPEDPDEDGDLFIPPNAGGGAWNGDRVLVHVSERKNRRGRREATVLRILSRGTEEVTGELISAGERYYVEPRSRKFPTVEVRGKLAEGVKVGDCVSVAVKDYGDGRKNPLGSITATLGENGTMEASINSVLHENGIYEHFDDDVLQQADSIPQVVDEATMGDRLDLRDKLIFTIDGDDAKDFDDAVSLEPLDNGHLLLGVHIADVSHYVTPGSPLDREAYARGTSVYYPGHVVPMLPFALSHGICSLNPDVDRLAFSALMEVDADGRRYGARFSKSIIRSKARMTYHKVNQMIDGDAGLREQYAGLCDTIERMNALAHALTRRRTERGALELDIPEAQIIVDNTGKPVDVQYRERGESERLIEEFMLMANEATAEYMNKKGQPTVYRVHENPDPEKLRAFAAFARPFGYRVDASKPEDTAQLQAVLRGAKGDPKQRVLPTLLLRSLARARYSAECIGHYGLKAKFYLHFTSPIRRYPDLMAHRMLQKSLQGGAFTAKDEEWCVEAAEQSTTREFGADTAERDIDKLYLACYMKQFLGEEFDGEVSGVTSFGLFVALPNGCEGLIRVEALQGDYFVYDEPHMTMVGQHSGLRYTIGSPLRVKVAAASEVTGQIDFVPAGAELPPEGAPRPSYPRPDLRGGKKKKSDGKPGAKGKAKPAMKGGRKPVPRRRKG